MAELANLDQLKGKLSIPLTDTSRDADLQIVLGAVTAFILKRTRYALVPTTVTDELHENIIEGSQVWTKLRPIDPSFTIVADARVYGATQYTGLIPDLIVPGDGQLRILGITGSLRIFPPPPPVIGLVRRHKAFRWPIVRLQYRTLEPDGLEDLSDACAAMAAYVERVGATGHLTSSQVGLVKDDYAALVPGLPAFPPALEALVAQHVVQQARLAS